MRLALVFVVLLAVPVSDVTAEPVFIDQLMEMSLSALQQQFPKLRNEGCYRIAPERYLWIDMEKKDKKPWRVALTSTPPCRRPEEGPVVDVRDRSGLDLGTRTREVLEKLGRPDASAAPENAFKQLGETEYFYICRVSEGCARHTSVFMRDGVVTAIASWYSE
jgi:hypothetical protein